VITVLVDDRVCYGSPALAIHGLSIHILADGLSLLLDVGPRFDVLKHNAGVVGIDLENVEMVALSHGHYDHVDALPELIELADPVIVAHPYALRQQYIATGSGLKYVGPSRRVLETLKKAKVVATKRPLEIARGIWFLGEIPRRYPWSAPWRSYVVHESGVEVHGFEDDTALALRVDGYGTVVISGCSHSGAHNIARYASEVVGERVRMFVGGPHLVGYGAEEYRKVANALRELGVERVVLCHCVEYEALKELDRVLKIHYGCCGAVIEIENGRVEIVRA